MKKILKEIQSELYHKEYAMLEDETWRIVPKRFWACAYFKRKSKVMLITVGKSSPIHYEVQMLYSIPVCSSYTFNNKTKQLNLK